MVFNPMTTAREETAKQDFGVLCLTLRERQEADALRAVLDRIHQAGTRRHALKVPAEVLIYILRRHAAGLSASAIARELNRLGITAPRGGLWYHAVVASSLRSGVLQLISDPVHSAIREAAPALRRVLDADDPERPVLRSADRRALRAAVVTLERI